MINLYSPIVQVPEVLQAPEITPLSWSLPSEEGEFSSFSASPRPVYEDIESIEIEYRKGTSGSYSSTTLTPSTSIYHSSCFKSTAIAKFEMWLTQDNGNNQLLGLGYYNGENGGTIYITIKAITIKGIRTEFP